jgi:uncharacterized protein YbjT (DUF2867 family)
MDVRVAITGAFGYTGRHITARLLQAGHDVRTLTRHPERDCFGGRVPSLPLDFAAEDGLAQALAGVEVFINTYWVRFPRGGLDHSAAVRHSAALFRAASRAGVGRIVHISITGADPRSPLPYFRGKGEVEALLRAGDIPHAVLRPSLLFGGEDVLIQNIAWILRRVPVFPLLGDGDFPLQPVHVADVADLAVQLAAKTGNLTVDAVGPERLSFAALVDAVAAAVGSRALLVPAPPRLAHGLAAALGTVVRDVVLTWDEVRGLMAGLLVAPAAPTGRRSFREWLHQEGQGLGRHYASELERHYGPGWGP